MNEQSDGITMLPQNLSVTNNIVSSHVRLMSCQLMLLYSSIGEMHRQASAQGGRRATTIYIYIYICMLLLSQVPDEKYELIRALVEVLYNIKF